MTHRRSSRRSGRGGVVATCTWVTDTANGRHNEFSPFEADGSEAVDLTSDGCYDSTEDLFQQLKKREPPEKAPYFKKIIIKVGFLLFLFFITCLAFLTTFVPNWGTVTVKEEFVVGGGLVSLKLNSLWQLRQCPAALGVSNPRWHVHLYVAQVAGLASFSGMGIFVFCALFLYIRLMIRYCFHIRLCARCVPDHEEVKLPNRRELMYTPYSWRNA